MNWSNYIMNLLLLLTAFGNEISPTSDVAEFDFNGNGVIDMQDFIHMLSLQPPIPEDDGLYYTYEEAGR
jgi:hypothetical protein